MQPDNPTNKNSFTCQGKNPDIRKKFEKSSNFLKSIFLSCGFLLTNIIMQITSRDPLSLYPGYKQYKEVEIDNKNG